MIVIEDEITFAVRPVPPPVAVKVMVTGVLAATGAAAPVSVQVATPFTLVATATIEASLLLQLNATVAAGPVRPIRLPYVTVRVVAMVASVQSAVVAAEAFVVIVPVSASPAFVRVTPTTMDAVLPYAAGTVDEVKLYVDVPITMLGIAFTL